MTTAPAKLTKIENLPAVKRLALIAGYSDEHLEAMRRYSQLMADMGESLTSALDELGQVIYEFSEKDERIRSGNAIKRGKPQVYCGDCTIVYDDGIEYDAHEFELLDKIRKAMLAAGHNPLIEWEHLLTEWESKTDE